MGHRFFRSIYFYFEEVRLSQRSHTFSLWTYELYVRQTLYSVHVYDPYGLRVRYLP